MSDVYTTTDTVAPLGVLQACAPVAPTGDSDAVEALVGATAGSVELAVNVPAASSVTGYAVELAIADDDTLSAGTLMMRMNVSSAQMDLTWTEVYVCRVNSSGVSQEELGNSTGMAKDISAGGVFSEPITILAPSAHNAGDRIYITCVFANAHTMTSRSVTITPSEDIDTPFTGGGQPPPSAFMQAESWRWRADDGSETAATWLAPVDTDVTIGTGEDIAFTDQVRVRQVTSNTGDADSEHTGGRLEYRVNGGSWLTVTETSTHVQYAASSVHVTDGEETTEQIGGTGTFDQRAGEFNSWALIDITGFSTDHWILAGGFGETEALLDFVENDWSPGDTVELRRVIGTNTPLDDYSGGFPAIAMPAGGVSGSLLAGTVSVAAGILTAALSALAAPLTAATVDVQAGVLAGDQAPLSAPMVAGTVDAQAGILPVSLGAQTGAITAGTVDTQAGILTGSAGGLDPVSGAITAGTVDVSGGVLAGSQSALSASLTAGAAEVQGGALTASQASLAAALTDGTVEARGGLLTATEGALAQALTAGTAEVRAGVLAGEAGGVAGTITTGTVEAKAGVLVGLASVGADLTAGTVEVRGGVLSGGSAPTNGSLTDGAVEVRAGVLTATPAATSAGLTAATVEARGHALDGTQAAKAGGLATGTVEVKAGALGGLSGQQPISAALVAGTVEVAASPFLFPVSPEQVVGAAPRDTVIGAQERTVVIGARHRDTIIGAS